MLSGLSNTIAILRYLDRITTSLSGLVHINQRATYCSAGYRTQSLSGQVSQACTFESGESAIIGSPSKTQEIGRSQTNKIKTVRDLARPHYHPMHRIGRSRRSMTTLTEDQQHIVGVLSMTQIGYRSERGIQRMELRMRTKPLLVTIESIPDVSDPHFLSPLQ